MTDVVDSVPLAPSWSIEIKDGKIVYRETTEIGAVESGKWQTVTFSRTGKDKRMTEKEFLGKLSSKNPSYSYSALLALALAKQQGAKFDPEPIELPKLRVAKLKDEGCYSVVLDRCRSIDGATTATLSSEQAKEVVRRCELIPRLRSLLSPYQVHTVGPLLDMIDGRDIQSAEGEDHAINP